ncbi:unnamed protein product [Lota lota]
MKMDVHCFVFVFLHQFCTPPPSPRPPQFSHPSVLCAPVVERGRERGRERERERFFVIANKGYILHILQNETERERDRDRETEKERKHRHFIWLEVALVTITVCTN